MLVEEVFEGPNPEHLHHLPRFKEIKETVWRGLTLQEFKLPSISLSSRVLFMARMILEPVKSLWTLCLFYLFLVKPEDCPVCATLKKKRKKPHIVLRCPRCQLPAHTSGTNGRNPVLNCPKHGRLSVMRSIEARCFFALCAVRVGQLVAAGLSQKKTAKLLGVTRTFVETVISTLAKHLPLPTPKLSGDLVVAFIDGFFSSRLAILVGKSSKNVLWAFGGENTVTINAFLKRLRKYVPEGATLVVVTDGNPSYVDPVRSILPKAIHVRHFHKTWNQVIVHYPLGNRVHSLYGPIDMLQRRNTARVIVWEGVRMNPPKPRKAQVVLEGELRRLLEVIMLINTHRKYDGRLLQRFTRTLRRLAELVASGEVDRRDVGETLKLLWLKRLSLRFREPLRQRIEEFRRATGKTQRRGSGDEEPYVKKRSSTRIFEGTLADAERQIEGVREVTGVLKRAFGEKKLVSSPVEGVNSIISPIISSKAASEKAVNLALLDLFSHTPFLRFEDVLCLTTSSIKRQPKICVHPYQLLRVRYTNRNGKTSLRNLLVLSVNGGKLSAYCFLRGEVRTFLRSRMEILHAQNIPLSS